MTVKIMREILFRGKRTDGKGWVYGVPVIVEDTDRILMLDTATLDKPAAMPSFHYDEVIPATVGQFTGLYDRNGKRVFEGDILKCRDRSENLNAQPAVIKYGGFNCSCCDGIYGWYSESDDCIRDLDTEPRENEVWGYEIVGNIHDNLELA